ncbi:MAG: hypothetical protein RJA58_1308, partial [Pseudomonadota bacterium]
PDLSTAALADLLTMAGLEVEEAEPLAPAFSGVVIARVISTEKHPDADRLRVCHVDIGNGAAPLQIVCGAPNVVPDMIAACATEGALLPGGFKIKRAKMRGVESQGMLCSAKELGISEESEGLMVLPASLGSALGQDLRQALSLDSQVLTLKLTPNRADCLSIAGVAREVSALTGCALTLPTWSPTPPQTQRRLSVTISADDLCGCFTGRVIEGVNAKAATPDWMRSRLEQAGQRSISVLVDISNYVMLELGRPSHIFDLDKVHGPLTVRWAKDGESLTLLNGQTVTLDASVGVIADDRGPESLAGIMGGESTAVSLETQNIYMEAAFWWPDSIRGRARRFNFSTDAGHRFERGVDWVSTQDHIEYMTHLVLSICGGKPGPIDDQSTRLPSRPQVTMRIARCRRVLGIDVDAKTCMEIFHRLGFAPTLIGDGASESIQVTPPSFRFDIEIEEDLIEEVARIYGFDRIPVRPPVAPVVMSIPTEERRSAMQLRDRLIASDYIEVVTYSFISKEAALAMSEETPLALLNPMASHQSVMRTSVLPGLLDCLATNVSRKQSRVRVFEIGRCFLDRPGQPSGDWTVPGVDQPLRIAGLAFGPIVDDQWGEPSRQVDFFDVKRDLEALAQPLRLTTRQLPAAESIGLHPGRAAQILIGDKVVGRAGELHPRLVQEIGLASPPVVFEMALDGLTQVFLPKITDVSRFPSVTRDLAVVVDHQTPAGAMIERLERLKSQSKQGSWITNIKCFDEYRGKGLSEKEKSLAFRFILQSPETTLQESEVDALMNEIITLLASEFSARLRS